MDALRRGGRAEGERHVESLAAHGYILERLEAIGAKRTAKWLTTALKHQSDEAVLARLDNSNKPRTWRRW